MAIVVTTVFLTGCAAPLPPPPPKAEPAPAACPISAQDLHLSLMRRHTDWLRALSQRNVEDALGFFDADALIVSPETPPGHPVSHVVNRESGRREFIANILLRPGREISRTPALRQVGGLVAVECDSAVQAGDLLILQDGQEYRVPASVTWLRSSQGWRIRMLHIEKLP